MDNYNRFILENFQSIRPHNDASYRPGLRNINLFETLDHEGLFSFRPLFILYKCKNDNEKYKNVLLHNIVDMDNLLERANILTDLGMFNDAQTCLDRYKKENGIYTKIIGARAYYKKYNNVVGETCVLEIGDMADKETADMASKNMMDGETVDMANREIDNVANKNTANKETDNTTDDVQNGRVLHGSKQANAHPFSGRKMYRFETMNHSFVSYRVCALTAQEQYLLLATLYLLIKSDCSDNHDQIHAYMDRLLFDKNEEFDSREYYLRHFRNVVYGEINETVFVKSYTFDTPLILNYEFYEVLADNLFKKCYFESALDIYDCLRNHEKMIKCYLGMGDKEKTIEGLEEVIREEEARLADSMPDIDRLSIDRPSIDRPNIDRPNIDRPNIDRPSIDRPSIKGMKEKDMKDEKTGTTSEDTSSRKDMDSIIRLAQTYNVLAELKNDPSLYKQSYRTYRSFVPMKLLALHHIRKREFKDALSALKQAHEHAPYNVSLLHMMGCLKQALQYDGISHFLTILSIDANNYETLINVGNYYTEKQKMEDALYFYRKAYGINKSAKLLQQIVEILEIREDIDGIRSVLRKEDKDNVLFRRNDRLVEMFDKYL